MLGGKEQKGKETKEVTLTISRETNNGVQGAGNILFLTWRCYTGVSLIIIP